jgi:hypothetical protein
MFDTLARLGFFVTDFDLGFSDMVKKLASTSKQSFVFHTSKQIYSSCEEKLGKRLDCDRFLGAGFQPC